MVFGDEILYTGTVPIFTGRILVRLVDQAYKPPSPGALNNLLETDSVTGRPDAAVLFFAPLLCHQPDQFAVSLFQTITVGIARVT